MIFPSNRVRIMVATKPVDFRKGLDGLCALVSWVLRKDPFTGTVFVFRSRRADRLKLFVLGRHRSGDGLHAAGGCALHLACHQGRDHGAEPCQFEALFAGLDWRKVKALEARPPAAAE